jgi:hypothetical protein
MGMLERPAKQQIITSSILWVILVGILVFIATIAVSSASIRNASGDVTKTIGIGPLKFMKIQKQTVGDMVQATLNFKPGIIIYMGILTLVAGAIIFIRFRKLAGQNKTEEN